MTAFEFARRSSRLSVLILAGALGLAVPEAYAGSAPAGTVPSDIGTWTSKVCRNSRPGDWTLLRGIYYCNVACAPEEVGRLGYSVTYIISGAGITTEQSVSQPATLTDATSPIFETGRYYVSFPVKRKDYASNPQYNVEVGLFCRARQ